MQNDYDVVIVGAGMVGLACAVALANTPIKIAIIENEVIDFDWSTTNYALRVSAINAASLQMLINFDIWDNICKERTSSYNKIHVWADNSQLEFSAASVNRPELGFIIENRVLRKALWERTTSQRNVDILCPTTLSDVDITSTMAKLTTAENKTITANLLIGADGANSWLRKQLNLPMKTHDYHHHALVTTVKTEKSHQQTAWQHFLPEGPLAFLPLDNPHYCSIVWSTTAKQAMQLKQDEVTHFNQTITAASTNKLGTIEACSARITFPLTMQHLQNYVTPHLAFIGDAAHRIHPLAGQGVNLGFMDAICLAENIKQTLSKQKNIAALVNLQRYQRERKYYNTQMLILMDLLKSSFATQAKTLVQLRSLGIEQTNKHHFLKNFLTTQALGIEQLPQNYLAKLI